MDDQEIVALFWSRSENAISETAAKYGSFCYSIAYNILTNNEDAEESVSDTYMAAWNAMPPRRPSILAPFLGKITRHLSIDRWRSRSRQKRGGGEITLALEELEEIASSQTMETAYARKQTVLVFNRFLKSLPETQRRIFLYNGPQEIDHLFQMNREHGKINQRKRKETILCHEGNTHRNLRPRSFWRYSRESGSWEPLLRRTT